MTKDMTNGNPSKVLIMFALPMILGNILQQFYGIVDSMIVGNFVGKEALAAVGASYPITFVLITISNGLGIGCGVIISQLFGAKDYKKTKSSIYTSLTFTLVLSTFFLILGVCITNLILHLLKTPNDIFKDASSYLKIYFWNVIFLFMYNIVNSSFNALGNSKIPLMFLIFSSVLNIVLDLYFVITLKMGVNGAAYATLIAQGVCAISSFIVLMHSISDLKVKERIPIFSLSILKDISKVAIPSILQQSIVSIGNLFVQALVNSFGSVVIAGYAAAAKIDSITTLPLANMSNAVSNFTAQNKGANKTTRINKGYKAAILIMAIFCAFIAIILFIFGNNIISMFVDSNTGKDVIEMGCSYLHVVSLFYFFMGLMVITNGVLRGIKDMKFFLLSTLTNLTSRIVFAYSFAAIMGRAAIWWAVPTGWILASVVSISRYHFNKKRIAKITITSASTNNNTIDIH